MSMASLREQVSAKEKYARFADYGRSYRSQNSVKKKENTVSTTSKSVYAYSFKLYSYYFKKVHLKVSK